MVVLSKGKNRYVRIEELVVEEVRLDLKLAGNVKYQVFHNSWKPRSMARDLPYF